MMSFLLSLFLSVSHAATLAGVEFPSQSQVLEKKLVLNGLGLREATIFNVDVYVAALYLESKSNQESKILSSKQKKKVILQFVRAVRKDDIQKAWKEAILKACRENCDSVRTKITELNSLVEDVSVGDRMEFVFHEDFVDVQIGKRKGKLSGEQLPQLLLSTWIGDHPPNIELKLGMLGLI